MQFSLMLEPQQGLSYASQLAVARRAESLGFARLLRSDHYESFPGPAGRATTDAWAVLAGLARETSRIRLGALVSPITFRLPGNLAKMAATVDEMSDGRLDLGMGAGWHEQEHRRHGFPFPDISVRAEMLEEQLAIVTGLLAGPDGFSFRGRHYTVEDAVFSPKSIQRPHPPIILGGEGRPRSMRLAARFADEFNLSVATPSQATTRFARLDAICREAGRDPRSLHRSVMVGVLVGEDEAEVRRRSEALMAFIGADHDPDEYLETRRPRWIIGTPGQARARVAEFVAAGAESIVLQDLLPDDLDMIELLGQELVARL